MYFDTEGRSAGSVVDKSPLHSQSYDAAVVGERQPPVPYVLAAQAALGEPPEKAKTLLHDLEAKMLALGAVEQALIPSPQLLNSARSEALTARAELMQALSK